MIRSSPISSACGYIHRCRHFHGGAGAGAGAGNRPRHHPESATATGGRHIDAAGIEQEINVWLAAHPAITVTDIKHSELGNIWSYAQLVVAIYYTEPAS